MIRYTSKNAEKKIYVSSTYFKDLNLPITRIKKMSSNSKPLAEFFIPVDGETTEHIEVEILPKNKMLGSKSYDLLVKAGSDPKNEHSIGTIPPELTDEKAHGLNETQKMLNDRVYAIKSLHTMVEYTLPPPVRIAIKRANNNYISEEEDVSPNKPKVRVRVEINRLRDLRLDASNEHQKSIFQRVRAPRQQRKSVFQRLGAAIQKRKPVFERLGPVKRKTLAFDKLKVTKMSKEFKGRDEKNYQLHKAPTAIHQWRAKPKQEPLLEEPEQLEESVGSSLHIIVNGNETIEENIRLILEELDSLDERGLDAQQSMRNLRGCFWSLRAVMWR
ncbi:hypothetical protein LIER_24837 [Lithospermum erythrorhizon]|uniref:Uncharacterized protein n=1 Tax=Lithospermum erythrorhizon TaxID=34254 RepID=A0AAV3R6U7_LITER